MDLKLFEARGVWLAGMLVSLSLLCVNFLATPAAGSAIGLAQVSDQDSGKGGGTAVEPVTACLLYTSPSPRDS